MSGQAYIQDIAGFLPGAPVSNDDTERLLGQAGVRPSRARRLVLRSNGIKTRYYAIDPDTLAPTHNNAQLTAAAVRGLAGNGDFALADMELLACGTSSPDQLMPNHAAMVHGDLGSPPCEIAAFAGICVSGVSALRYAALAVAAGDCGTAVATGSELASSFMRAGMFAGGGEAQVAEALARQPEQTFRRDFLRWMLSDGAGAMLVRDQPAARGLSLRIDWIEQRSFASELPACMYAGADKRDDGSLRGWREYPSSMAAVAAGAFAVKQDVRLLNEHVIDVCFRRGLEQVRCRRHLAAADIDWFVPHYSSDYFRPRLAAAMAQADFAIPESRWVSRLAEIGNIGAASIYLHLRDLLAGGGLRDGQRVLCLVPESGRFSTAFMHMTVVDRED